MNWLVDRRISSGFALAMLLLIVIGVVAYDDISSLVSSAGWVSHTQVVLGKLEQILSEIEDVQSGCRGFLISGDPAYLQPYTKGQIELQSEIDSMKIMTHDNPVQTQGLDVLEPLIKRELYLTREMVQNRKGQSSGAGTTHSVMTAERDTMQAIRKQIDDMQRHELSLLYSRNLVEKANAGSAKWTVGLGTFVAILVLGFTLYVLNLETYHRIRTQTQLERANAVTAHHARQLETANKELEAFSYSVSHDLRAPLRHINGFLQLLRDQSSSSLDEKSRRYINTIIQAATRMGQLIDDLLSFSRVGRVELKKTPINLDDVVAEIVTEQKMEAPDRAITWDIKKLPAVSGDPTMLRQVFVNLIANAVKYSRSREKAEIGIGSMPKDGELCFYVRDNGVGFDMAHVGKLFGVFQRLHREEDFEGTGIGLANVQRIIHRHRGRVWAEGAVDQGATFYFTLPRSS